MTEPPYDPYASGYPSAFGLFGYVALKASDFHGFGSVTSSVLGGTGGGSGTDTSTVRAIGLIFGLGYYAIAAVLDARGRAGTAAWAAGFVLGCGLVVQGAADSSYVGNGLTLMVIGLAVVAAAAHALGAALRKAPEIDAEPAQGAGWTARPAG